MAPKRVYSNNNEKPHPLEPPESFDDIILEPRRFWALPWLLLSCACLRKIIMCHLFFFLINWSCSARDSILIGIFSGFTFGVWVASVKAESKGFQAIVQAYPKYGLLSFAGMTFLSLGVCGTKEVTRKLRARKNKLQEEFDSDVANQPVVQRHILDRELRRQKIRGRNNDSHEEQEEQ